MKTATVSLIAGLLLFAVAASQEPGKDEAADPATASGQESGEKPAKSPDETADEQTGGSSESQVQRGKYLVHHVAMCVQCHTPRTRRGELIERRLLQGAAMPVKSPYPEQVWAFEAPWIAGLPAWSDDEFISLLTEGSRPDASGPRPPMPPFRMTRSDAQAIAAYLRSLGT